MDKNIIEKIKSAKCLEGKSIGDILLTERFMHNLSAYWIDQKRERAKAVKSYKAIAYAGRARGMRLPAHIVDCVLDSSVEDLRDEYLLILKKQDKASSTRRRYISQLCQQAYNLTVAQMVCEEFPELSNVLLKK